MQEEFLFFPYLYQLLDANVQGSISALHFLGRELLERFPANIFLFFPFFFLSFFFPLLGNVNLQKSTSSKGWWWGFLFLYFIIYFHCTKKEKNQMGVDKVRACTDTSFWTCRVLRLPLFKVFCVVKKWTIYLFIYLTYENHFMGDFRNCKELETRYIKNTRSCTQLQPLLLLMSI